VRHGEEICRTCVRGRPRGGGGARAAVPLRVGRDRRGILPFRRGSVRSRLQGRAHRSVQRRRWRMQPPARAQGCGVAGGRGAARAGGRQGQARPRPGQARALRARRGEDGAGLCSGQPGQGQHDGALRHGLLRPGHHRGGATRRPPRGRRPQPAARLPERRRRRPHRIFRRQPEATGAVVVGAAVRHCFDLSAAAAEMSGP